MPKITVTPPQEYTATREAIRAHALKLGFDVCRFTTPPPDTTDTRNLKAWLKKGYHGTMGWMANKPEVRGHPHGMWAGVHSIVALGFNYAPPNNPLRELEHANEGYISVYARGDDYHDLIKKKLKQLGTYMAQTHGATLKVFVDTAPVMEKPLAARAGLGWQGKHTVLLSREFGNYLFLGMIYSDLPLPADPPAHGSCGRCTKCQDICPTQAFPKPYQLDARRCISYLTIEHKGSIPHEFRKPMGNRIYGCDDCTAICPWNKFAQTATEQKFHARETLKNPPLATLLQLDDARFRELFKKSPVKRIGLHRFLRNVLIAAGNSGNPALLAQIRPLTTHPDPVVAEAADWAAQQVLV